MKNISGNCCIPFGFFGQNVPEHVITSIEIINNKFIVTGDAIGQIIVWKVKSLVDIVIYWYLIGHNDKISNICNISTVGSDDDYFVTFSVSREIGVWNCADGRCVKFDRNISFDHSYVLSYKPSSRPNNLLLCCGKYPGVHVLDSLSLTTTMQLRSRGYPDWVQSVCAFEHQQAGVHVVLGLSVVGAAILWTIDTLDTSAELQLLYETESRMLMISSPVSISMCPFKPRFVLVISSSLAQIYDAANWTLLCQTSVEKTRFLSGKFLDVRTILLQLKNGNMHLYRVPFPLDMPIDVQNDLPLDLEKSSLLGSLSEDNLCHTILLELNELTVVSGHSSGVIDICKSHLLDDQNISEDTMSTILSFSLSKQWTQKNFLSITDSLSHLWKVTYCHYTKEINSLIMGMENGDIVIADMLHTMCGALFPKYTSSLAHIVLNGHNLPIRALLYAETKPDDKKLPYKWLWSGGADYSVRLWDFEGRKCVRVFDCHTGPVKCFIKGPILGLTRAKTDGHIRAQRNKENIEQEVIKPINSDSWLGENLYVSIDEDNSIAFLSLDTKRVVLRMRFCSEILTVSWRRDHIVAMVECADGSVTVWELGNSQMDRCVSGQMAKDLLDSGTDKIRFRNLAEFSTKNSSVNNRIKRNVSSSLIFHSLQCGMDKYCHIVMVDTEALLVDLYGSHNDIGAPPRSFIEAQLLLSLINHWGTDICLDKTLESSLGLVPVNGMISNGHTSSRFGTLSFQLNTECIDNAVLGTQRLISGVAICHALNNLPEKPSQYVWTRLVQYLSSMPTYVPESGTNADSRTTMRQVCCLFATSLATFTLTKLLGTDNDNQPLQVFHIQLVLQYFLQKYQDRCLEIREAARTLFNATMDSLLNEQRTEIVQKWVIQTRVLEFADDIPDKMKELHRSSVSSIHDIVAISDWRNGWALAELYEPQQIARMQLTTIAFLAAVGSRYGCLDNRTNQNNNTVVSQATTIYKTIPGFGIEDYRLARITCGHLMRILTQSQFTSTWPDIRRLAITFLGQGFPVWEPYLEVATLFSKLLEIVAGSEKTLSGWNQGELLSDDMDACRSAKIALLAIALARPKVFATVLSIDVLRLQMANSSNTAPLQMTNGSLTQKTATTIANPTQPPLLAARHEVVDIIKVLCERKTREMHDVFPEIMDVLLACLNKLELRQFDLQQLFPPILLFRIASSHTASGKVCVGTKTGHIVFYDVKLGKYNSSPGHRNAVTSVTFSPDGKQVASYSMPDNSVCIWQLSSSGLFGMGSSHQVRLASTLNVPPVAISKTVSEEDSSLLLWLEWYENRSIHLVTNAGLVNKIKL